MDEQTVLIVRSFGAARCFGATRPAGNKPSADILRPGLCRRRSGADRRTDRPAAQLLSQGSARLDPVPGHGLSRRLQCAVDHQTGLRADFGFRPAVRLSPQIVSHPRQSRRGRRLSLVDATLPAGRSRDRPDDHGLCHGDFEHAVRRGARGERPEAQRERRVRQPAMALVQHRRHGGRNRRRPARAAPRAGVGPAHGSRRHRGRALCRHHRRIVFDSRNGKQKSICKAHATRSAALLRPSRDASCGSWQLSSFSTISVPA